jgi:hypothetical protein
MAPGRCVRPSPLRLSVPTLNASDSEDDERFNRHGQRELFDQLGAHDDTRLQAYPGQHSDDGPEAFEVQAALLKRYLERAEASWRGL